MIPAIRIDSLDSEWTALLANSIRGFCMRQLGVYISVVNCWRLIAGFGFKFLRQTLDDFIRRFPAFAGRVTEPAGARAILNIENHVVILTRRDAIRHVVESKAVTYFPGDYMIGA